MRSWKDFGIFFQDTIETMIFSNCPKCHVKEIPTLIVNREKEEWFCEHCGFAGDLISGQQLISKSERSEIFKYNPNIPVFEPTPLSEKIIKTFEEKGITEEVLKKYNISQVTSYFPEQKKEYKSLVFPYYRNHKLVNLVYQAGSKKHSELGGVDFCYGYDDIQEDATYIVYDEMEKLTFASAGISNCISLFGGEDYVAHYKTNKAEQLFGFLEHIEGKLNKVKKVILAMPYKPVSEFILDELSRRIGREKVWIVKPPEAEYTWNQVFVDYGQEKFLELLAKSDPYPVRGIHDIDDVEAAFDDLYTNGLKRGASTGFKTMDEYYTVLPGQWTVVTGIPGHGKSNFLDATMVNLAMLHGWSFAIFSPENQPIQRHFANILEKYLDAPFNYGLATRITEEQKEHGKEWLKKHFSIILPHEDDNWGIDGILTLAKVLVFRKGIKGLIIDPWNELDHSRPSNFSETEYISSVLTKIRSFARNYDVHVWLVAHPAKLSKNQDGKYPVPTPYDIAGCYAEDTEVLTEEGWVPHKDITLEHKVACFDLEKNKMHFAHPEKIWDYDYEGEMYSFNGKHHHCLVTPNHKMVVWDKENIKWVKKEAKELTQHDQFIPQIIHTSVSGYIPMSNYDLIHNMIMNGAHKTIQADTSFNVVPHYKGKVYCLTVPTGAYMTKRDGKTMIAGNSAHFRNKADNAISVWRNVGGPDQDIADVHIQKIRFKEIGKVGFGSLRYNAVTGRFIDDIDQNKRKRALESGDEIETAKLRK